MDVQVDQLVHQWTEGHGKATRRAYRHDLALIASVLGHEHWGQIDRATVAHVLGVLRQRFSPNTVRRVHACIKALAGELAEAGLITGLVYLGIRRQKLAYPKVDPVGRFVERHEQAKLFQAALEVAHSEEEGLILCGALALGFGGGLRYSEICGLNSTDYEPETGRVRVRHGKGDKQRFIYLAGPAKKHATAAFSWGVRWSRFTPFLWDSLRYRAGMPDLKPHDMRRTFASSALDAGIDIATVADLMGHVNVQTTMRYDRRGEERKVRAAKVLMEGPS